MPERVYKKIRVVGCSEESFDQAVAIAIKKASETLHGLAWFEVIETRGAVREGVPSEWQVTLELGFRIDS